MSSLKPTAKITQNQVGYTVWIAYPDAGVDRPLGTGTACGMNYRLAERLAAAINAGAATANETIATDVNGNTYVQATRNFLGRTLNADLKRLGF